MPPRGVAGTEQEVTDRLSSVPEGDPQRDEGICTLFGCASPWGCWEVWSVAEADTVPPCLLFAADSSSIAEDSVSVGFVIIRLSAREVTPSVTRELVLN